MTLQALVRNFHLINNFATLTPCTAEALSYSVVFMSLISLPKDMSEVILNPVPSKKKHNGVRISAAQEIWVQNY
jgi:hypothetical protein